MQNIIITSFHLTQPKKMIRILLYIVIALLISHTNPMDAYQVSNCLELINSEDCTTTEAACKSKMRFDYEVNGLKVTFRGEVASDYEKIIWDFGDGKEKEFLLKDTIAFKKFSHKYTKTGVYKFAVKTIFKNCETTRIGTIYAFDFKD